MKKAFLRIAALLVVAILLSTSVAFAAASEKRVEVVGGNYLTVSNVTQEQEIESDLVLTATAPVKVTFNGNNLCLENILLSKSKRQDNTIQWSQEAYPVKFDVKKYTLFDDKTKVYDELTQESDDLTLYVSGNYATLSKPGIYYVYAGPEAEAPTTIAIEVVAAGAAVDSQPKQDTKPAPVAEPAVKEQAPAAKPAATASAAATASKVLVNGKQVSFEAYNINESNYFKLRDLAMAVNGTAKNFEVGWDSANNAISLTSAKAYTKVGGELAVSANPTTKQAELSTSKVYLNGKEVQLTAYTIGGNNYFKLRDIAKALDIGITWDNATSTIGIDTAISYKE